MLYYVNMKSIENRKIELQLQFIQDTNIGFTIMKNLSITEEIEGNFKNSTLKNLMKLNC